MITISKELSDRIKLLNILSVLMVVGIHCRPSIQPVFYTVIGFTQELLSNGLFRIAVPLLFLLSGLLFFKDVGETFNSYYAKLKSRVRSLLIPYLLYSILILVLNRLLQIAIGANSTLNNTASNDIKVNNLTDVLFLWLFDPVQAIHLWFLRDLIVLTILSPLIFLLIYRTAGIFLPITFLLWLLEIQPFPKLGHFHLLNVESIAFFCLGVYLAQGKIKVEKLLQLPNWALLSMVIWVVGNVVRIVVDPGASLGASSIEFSSMTGLVAYKFSIIAGIIAVLYLSQFVKCGWLLGLSNLSFAIYLFHAPLHVYIGKILSLLRTHEDLFFILKYSLTVGFTVLGVLVLRERLPGVYQILSGARGAKRDRQFLSVER